VDQAASERPGPPRPRRSSTPARAVLGLAALVLTLQAAAVGGEGEGSTRGAPTAGFVEGRVSLGFRPVVARVDRFEGIPSVAEGSTASHWIALSSASPSLGFAPPTGPAVATVHTDGAGRFRFDAFPSVTRRSFG